jgi:glycosyltransferase involved in cell wall biosynthesis
MAVGYVVRAQALLANPALLPAPLVSCVMPTYNRRRFVPQAIDLFLRQDYPNRELIILDDGEDAVEDLLPNDERVRYIRPAERLTIGQKHNLGCQAARGTIIAHWDDDVWSAGWRLSYQVAALIEQAADLCGLDNWLKYDPFTGRAWQVVRPPGDEPWMPGNTFCYRKSLWEARPFDERQLGFDIAFLRQRPEAKIVALRAAGWLVDIVHGENVSPQDPRSPLWHPYPLAEIRRILGDDWAFYEQLTAGIVASGES